MRVLNETETEYCFQAKNKCILIIRKQLTKSFNEELFKYFKIMINSYDEENHDEINNILQEIELERPVQLCLIINSWIGGIWLQSFNQRLTSRESFFIRDDFSIQCDMMNIEKTQFFLNYHSNPIGLDIKMCEFQYRNTNFSMTVILPNRNISLDLLEMKLCSNNLLNKLLHLPVNMRTINVKLPKFKIEF